MALLTPAVLLMLGHGIVSAGLSFCVGSLYERTHTRDLNLLASGAAVLPKLSFYFLLFILGNIAFPGTVNFVAEFAILKGLLYYDPLVVILIMPSYFANAAFNIWLLTRVLYGQASKLRTVIHPEDFTFGELMIVRSLCFIMIAFGTFFTDLIVSQIEKGLALEIPQYYVNEYFLNLCNSKVPLHKISWSPLEVTLSLYNNKGAYLQMHNTVVWCTINYYIDAPNYIHMSHVLGLDTFLANKSETLLINNIYETFSCMSRIELQGVNPEPLHIRYKLFRDFYPHSSKLF